MILDRHVRWITYGLLLSIAVMLPALGSAEDAAAGGSPHKVRLLSTLEMQDPSGKHQVVADTEYGYTWQAAGADRTLLVHSIKTAVHYDGKAAMNAAMTRAKFTETKDEKVTELEFEKAPDRLKTVLKDSFDSPICKLQVEENGKIVKRVMVAGIGAKGLIENGMIANALLFHPPYQAAQDEWQSEAEISMGNNDYAKGTLTYKKEPGSSKVQVSGTVRNEKFRPPGTPPNAWIKAVYRVTGDQTYDPVRKEWVSGTLTLEATLDIFAGEKREGGGSGKIVATLETPKPDK